ncbi:MAG: putative transposase [Paracoccaceae bacterium]|jgi:putative transposase
MVFFYVRYVVSYRDLEEQLAERGIAVDHATLNRWLAKYSPSIAANTHTRERSTAVSWCMAKIAVGLIGLAIVMSGVFV